MGVDRPACQLSSYLLNSSSMPSIACSKLCMFLAMAEISGGQGVGEGRSDSKTLTLTRFWECVREGRGMPATYFLNSSSMP